MSAYTMTALAMMPLGQGPLGMAFDRLGPSLALTLNAADFAGLDRLHGAHPGEADPLASPSQLHGKWPPILAGSLAFVREYACIEYPV